MFTKSAIFEISVYSYVYVFFVSIMNSISISLITSMFKQALFSRISFSLYNLEIRFLRLSCYQLD